LRALALLESKDLSDLEVVDVVEQPEKRVEMEERAGRRTIPQIFIDDEHIGGCDDLMALEKQGQLDSKLGLKELG